MDLTSYNLEELLLAAIKSEEESNQVYSKLADHVQNGLMKDKFQFLASEEQKHKQYIIDLYKSDFPDKTLHLPEKTPVPLPGVTIPKDEDIPVSKVLSQAMEAEQAAHDFYLSLSERYENTTVKNMLHYFADMETGHYNILKQEKESMEWFEQSDVYWPMIHAGP
ncbi:MAG: ferritin family protein [Candidatus Thermoplasmatota archaeon]|nr:ferritin family protein [Candidatus Thermoplasmatota archaeon]MBS3801492.1 ferritin family protein [Candidatus Thermoplasmatota archaeon]